MSTVKLNQSVDILSVRYIKLSRVAEEEKEDLADFVRRIREGKGLSVNQVALKSGGGISKAYVSQIENRYVQSVTAGRLRALARGLGISYEEISAIAGGGNPLTDEDFIQSQFGSTYQDYIDAESKGSLTDDQKITVREVLKMLSGMLRRVPLVQFDNEKKPRKKKAS